MDTKAKAWMVLILFVSGVVIGPVTEGARDDHHMGMKEDDHNHQAIEGGGYYYNPQALWRWGAAASWLGAWLPLGIWAICCSGRGGRGMSGHRHMGMDLGNKGHFGIFGAATTATDNTHEMASAAAAATNHAP